MSFKSFLSAFGHDVKRIADVAVPVAQASVPFLNILAPGVGTAVGLALNTVVSVEQKFAAQNAPSGSGPQKLAEVLGIVGPAMQQLLASEGISGTSTDITNIINAVVAGLNAIPAPAVPVSK
jgi:hypothetical protein